MQYVKDLFRKDIYRKIEEVIKVDQDDEGTVKIVAILWPLLSVIYSRPCSLIK